MFFDVLEICRPMKRRYVPIEVTQPFVDSGEPRSDGV
jgi:hypothetical protein